MSPAVAHFVATPAEFLSRFQRLRSRAEPFVAAPPSAFDGGSGGDGDGAAAVVPSKGKLDAEELYERGLVHHEGSGLVPVDPPTGPGGAMPQGLPVPQNDAWAAGFYERASALGHPGAQFALGLMTEQGRGGRPRDSAAASQLFYAAARGGSAGAMHRLAAMHLVGAGGLEQLPAAAYHLWSTAAQGGMSEALVMMGQLHEHGLSGEGRNATRALELYETAANTGPAYFYAQRHLARLRVSLRNQNLLPAAVAAAAEAYDSDNDGDGHANNHCFVSQDDDEEEEEKEAEEVCCATCACVADTAPEAPSSRISSDLSSGRGGGGKGGGGTNSRRERGRRCPLRLYGHYLTTHTADRDRSEHRARMARNLALEPVAAAGSLGSGLGSVPGRKRAPGSSGAGGDGLGPSPSLGQRVTPWFPSPLPWHTYPEQIHKSHLEMVAQCGARRNEGDVCLVLEDDADWPAGQLTATVEALDSEWRVHSNGGGGGRRGWDVLILGGSIGPGTARRDAVCHTNAMEHRTGSFRMSRHEIDCQGYAVRPGAAARLLEVLTVQRPQPVNAAAQWQGSFTCLEGTVWPADLVVVAPRTNLIRQVQEGKDDGRYDFTCPAPPEGPPSPARPQPAGPEGVADDATTAAAVATTPATSHAAGAGTAVEQAPPLPAPLFDVLERSQCDGIASTFAALAKPLASLAPNTLLPHSSVVYTCRGVLGLEDDCGGFGDRLAGVFGAAILSLFTFRPLYLDWEGLEDGFAPLHVDWRYDAAKVVPPEHAAHLRFPVRVAEEKEGKAVPGGGVPKSILQEPFVPVPGLAPNSSTAVWNCLNNDECNHPAMLPSLVRQKTLLLHTNRGFNKEQVHYLASLRKWPERFRDDSDGWYSSFKCIFFTFFRPTPAATLLSSQYPLLVHRDSGESTEMRLFSSVFSLVLAHFTVAVHWRQPDINVRQNEDCSLSPEIVAALIGVAKDHCPPGGARECVLVLATNSRAAQRQFVRSVALKRVFGRVVVQELGAEIHINPREFRTRQRDDEGGGGAAAAAERDADEVAYAAHRRASTQQAMRDWWLLQSADVLVKQPDSGFSSSAALVARKPQVVYDLEGVEFPPPPLPHNRNSSSSSSSSSSNGRSNGRSGSSCAFRGGDTKPVVDKSTLCAMRFCRGGSLNSDFDSI